MKLLAASLLFFTCPQPASALKVPSYKQIYEIDSLMKEAQRAVRRGDGDVYDGAFETRAMLAIQLGIPLDPLGNPTREPTDAELAKPYLVANAKSVYERADRVVKERQRIAAAYYSHAIAKSREYYRMGREPGYDSGIARSGPPEWRGQPIQFDPTYSAEPQPSEAADPGSAFRNKPAFTGWLDSSRPRLGVIIRPTAFKYPGYLAMLLWHEQRHVALSLDPYVDLRNRPDTERIIRADVLAREAVFELEAEDWEDEFFQAAVQASLAVEWRRSMNRGHDPYKNPEIFHVIRLSEAKVAEIQKAVKADLGLLNAVAALPAAEGNAGSPEYLRTHAETEFMKSMIDQQLVGIAKGFQVSRELAAKRTERNFKMVVAGLEFEAERCGFSALTPENTRGDDYGFERKRAIGTPFQWFFNRSTNIEAGKVDYLLARACFDAFESDGIGAPCNEAVDIINRRWKDPDFKSRFDLGTNGRTEQNACLKRLGRLTPPIAFADIKRAATEVLDEFKARWRRTSEESRRRSQEEGRRPKPKPEKSPERRGGSDGGRQSGDEYFWDEEIHRWVGPPRR